MTRQTYQPGDLAAMDRLANASGFTLDHAETLARRAGLQIQRRGRALFVDALGFRRAAVEALQNIRHVRRLRIGR